MTTYWHGGRSGIQRGAYILPPTVTKTPSLSEFGAAGVHRRDRVYVTTSQAAALLYAASVKQKGWLHEQDPRGWFLWYCRYYLGRRSEDDKRQIKRWKAIKRHIAQVMRHCKTGDFKCRPKQRQAILHWAYDSRKI
jgi:hypothetical protein